MQQLQQHAACLVLNRFLKVVVVQSVSSQWWRQVIFAFGFLFDGVLAEEESLDRALTEPYLNLIRALAETYQQASFEFLFDSLLAEDALYVGVNSVPGSTN